MPAELSKVHPTFHVSLLKRHKGAMPLQRTPVFTGASDEPEYEVEAIVAKRLGKRNKPEYLV